MKISLNNEIIKSLESLLKGLNSNLQNDNVEELEFRLGNYSDSHGKTKFEPGVSQKLFHKLKSYLDRRVKEDSSDEEVIFSRIVKSSVEKSVTNYYNNDIREIIIEGNVPTYQRKEKSINIEIPFSVIGVRLSKSLETSISKPSNLGKITFKREKIRYKYEMHNAEIDLTIVDSFLYEIEIEFTKQTKTVPDLIDPLKSVLMILFPTRYSIILDQDSLGVVDLYNKVFVNEIKRKNAKLNPGQVFRFELKPRNIKRNDVINMKNMAVTNKLNGVGTNLFICEKGIYLVNSTSIEKISSSVISDLSGSIFPSEFKDGICHVFDCIKFQGRDISHIRNHSIRLENFTKILSRLQQLKVPVECKYFVHTGNLAEDTKEIVRYMYKRYGEQAIEENDGIVYTPIDMPYLNDFTLKFKYTKTMTIDFEFSNMSFVKGPVIDKGVTIAEKIFDLEVTNKQNGLTNFGKIQVRSDNRLFDELENGVIVECSYNKEKQIWIPYRIRDDKSKPNFISVAKDVFDDIQHPLELDELISLFENKPYKEESEEDKKIWEKYQKERRKELVDKCMSISKNKNDMKECLTNSPMYNQQEDSLEDERKYSGPSDEPEFKKWKGEYRPTSPDFPPPPSPPPSRHQNQNQSCLKVMRKEHGNDKRKLINKYLKDKSLVDFGFGKGGVIHAYNDANVGPIYAIEPSESYLAEAKKRMKNMDNKDFHKTVKLIHAKAQEKLKIMDEMKNKKADNGAAFFSLTFSFENESELDKWISSMVGTIKTDGYFVGNTMDGEMTYNFLKGKDKIEEKGCYLIEKRYQDDDEESYGKKIYIKLLEDDTIVEGQEEYLVFYNIFKAKMEKSGFYEIETSLFEPSNRVDPRASQFSRLFRNFVFQRRLTENEKAVIKRKEENEQQVKEERKNRLSSADMDQNLKFNTNYGETSIFVRTGTVPDGSCFFHAVLTSIDSVYRKLSASKREKYVAKLRIGLSENLNQKSWESFGGGMLSYSLVIPRFVKYITDRNLYPELTNVLYTEAPTLSAYINNLNLILTSHLETQENVDMEKEVKKFLHIFSTIRKRSFESFKERLEDCSAWVGQDPSTGSLDVFEYISDFFNVDIYLLKDTTRKPYNLGVDCNLRYKNRRSIIVLWVGDSHYEAVAKFNPITKKIQRKFQPDEGVIQRIKSLIC